MKPFTPTGPTVSISPLVTTVTATLVAGTGAGTVQRVTNASDLDVFLTFGAAGVLATSHPLQAGDTQDFIVNPDIVACGVISTGTATGDVYFTPGQTD